MFGLHLWVSSSCRGFLFIKGLVRESALILRLTRESVLILGLARDSVLIKGFVLEPEGINCGVFPWTEGVMLGNVPFSLPNSYFSLCIFSDCFFSFVHLCLVVFCASSVYQVSHSNGL